MTNTITRSNNYSNDTDKSFVSMNKNEVGKGSKAGYGWSFEDENIFKSSKKKERNKYSFEDDNNNTRNKL